MKRTLWVEGSSLISRIDYWPDSKELDVLFIKNGALYRYQDITLGDFATICAGESVGKAFTTLISDRSNYERLA